MSEPKNSLSDAENNYDYVRGMTMAGATMLLWGFLPIFLKVALKEFTTATVVGFRFAFAFVLLFIILQFRGSGPAAILRRPPLLGLLAGVALAANYYSFMEGVNFSGPANAATLIQIAPLIVVFIGVFLFREKLSRRQIFGLMFAAAGFYLFYSDQRDHADNLPLYSSANLYIVFAGVIWAVYVACQKHLTKTIETPLLNLLVYGTAAVVLVPGIDWKEFVGISMTSWLLIAFLGVNTVLAYGALAEAIKHMPLTYVSVVITLNPLVTLSAVAVIPEINSTWLDPEKIGLWGYFGALTALAGVIIVVSKKIPRPA